MRNKGIKIVLNVLIIAVVVTVILGYTYFKTKDYIQGPRITINTPQNGMTITENPLIPISGTTECISNIHLNGKKIFVDKNGNFNENILLHTGYNIIVVEVSDRFKKTVQKKVEVIYQDT